MNSFRFVLALGVLAMLAGSACVPGEGNMTQEVTLKFAAAVGDETAQCDQMYEGLGTTAVAGEFADIRFYVSNIRLINDSGEEVAVELTQDGKWQHEGVALLDFEDGSGICGDIGNADLNDEVVGTVPTGNYDGIVFDLGVPFELNHDDLTDAPPPLNVSAMWWTWAIGHKFLRVDVQTEDELRWNMHLGSTMCESDGPMDPPTTACARPNVPVIAFDSFDPAGDEIVLDIEALFANSDLATDTPDTASGCQTFPNDVNECTSLFPNLGLDFTTGRCFDDCTNQTVFTVRAQ